LAYPWLPAVVPPGLKSGSPSQQKLLAVDDGPQHVFPRGAVVPCVRQECKKFLRLHLRWLATERREVKFFQYLRVGLARREQLRDAVVRVADHRVRQLARDELERLEQPRVVVPLTLAREQSVRLAEHLEEAFAHAVERPAAAALRRGRHLV